MNVTILASLDGRDKPVEMPGVTTGRYAAKGPPRNGA